MHATRQTCGCLGRWSTSNLPPLSPHRNGHDVCLFRSPCVTTHPPRAANCHYIYVYVCMCVPDDPSTLCAQSFRFEISLREVYRDREWIKRGDCFLHVCLRGASIFLIYSGICVSWNSRGIVYKFCLVILRNR